jgi:hypothetical protein
MQIDLDLSDLERWSADLIEVAEEIPAAISRSVNRTGDMVRTAIGRELAAETGLLVRVPHIPRFAFGRAPSPRACDTWTPPETLLGGSPSARVLPGRPKAVALRCAVAAPPPRKPLRRLADRRCAAAEPDRDPVQLNRIAV